jgi:hypothetical protein
MRHGLVHSSAGDGRLAPGEDSLAAFGKRALLTALFLSA